MVYTGFNFQWMFTSLRGQGPEPPDERALDFLQRFGFNFVRIPTDYRFWTRDFDYLHPDEDQFKHIDAYLHACESRRLHMSLNMHRAPGYCINRNDLERDNLWTDEVAQEGFAYQWRLLAERYRSVPGDVLSFDLVNEPPNEGQYGMTRERHAAVIRRAVAAIREADLDRPIAIDGIGGGGIAVPELADLGAPGALATHSTRGYQPMPISHHAAEWWPDYASAPEPKYPGLEWDGRVWDRQGLVDFYRPWREVEAQGLSVHVGEFGCYNKVDNDLALRWLGDLLSIFREFGWGYAMWNFEGPFGIINHGRSGARYETLDGYRVDRDLLELMRGSAAV